MDVVLQVPSGRSVRNASVRRRRRRMLNLSIRLNSRTREFGKGMRKVPISLSILSNPIAVPLRIHPWLKRTILHVIVRSIGFARLTFLY